MDVTNKVLNTENPKATNGFGDLPPPAPYQGYLDLSSFELDYYTQCQALFAGDPPLISTAAGQAQFLQLLDMIQTMAKFCNPNSAFSKAAGALEDAFVAYARNPSAGNLQALESANTFFSTSSNFPPITNPADAQKCIGELLLSFLNYINTTSPWPTDPSSPLFALVQYMTKLVVDIVHMNPAAEGNYQGNFWKDLISYQDPTTGQQWGVLPDGETFWNVIMQYVEPTSSGPLPSQSDLEAVIADLYNDL